MYVHSFISCNLSGVIDRNNGRKYVAWDIETTGFGADDVLSVAGFWFPDGHAVLFLNVYAEAFADTSELEQQLRDRTEGVIDERVRRALERGCDRSTVLEIFDIAERPSWHKQRRAQAYDFPLGALERGGSTSESDHGADEPSGAGAGGQQQGPVVMADADGAGHNSVSATNVG